VTFRYRDPTTMKNHTVIDDPTLAGRYLADQLSDAECAEFEARLIQDPEAVAELEATARLKIGLERLRRSGELTDLISEPSESNRVMFIAVAASVVAVVIGASLWIPRSTAPSTPLLASAVSAFKDHNGHSLAVVASEPLFRTRAEAYDAVIALPPTRGAIKLRVLPTTVMESASYEASLSRISDDNSSEKIVSIGGLRPSAGDGFIDLYADSALLSPGRYRLVLTRQTVEPAAATDSDTFVIKVAPGGP
jgi:hypothetical protein